MGFTYVACRVAPEGGGVHERDRVLLSRIFGRAAARAPSGRGGSPRTKGVPRMRDTPCVAVSVRETCALRGDRGVDPVERLRGVGTVRIRVARAAEVGDERVD